MRIGASTARSSACRSRLRPLLVRRHPAAADRRARRHARARPTSRAISSRSPCRRWPFPPGSPTRRGSSCTSSACCASRPTSRWQVSSSSLAFATRFSMSTLLERLTRDLNASRHVRRQSPWRHVRRGDGRPARVLPQEGGAAAGAICRPHRNEPGRNELPPSTSAPPAEAAPGAGSGRGRSWRSTSTSSRVT